MHLNLSNGCSQMKCTSCFINISVLVKDPSKFPPAPAQFLAVGRKKALKTASLEAATIGVEPMVILMICSLNSL